MKSVPRKPIDLNLPTNLCRYDPSTDTTRDMRTGEDVGVLVSDYQFFSTWFESKVDELKARLDAGYTQRPETMIAEILVSALVRERALAS